MAEQFRSREDLVAAVADRSFDRPPAIVCNAHVTGLAVARALHAQAVPVIAVDRNGDGVAPYSDAVELAGRVTYPLEDPEGFRADLEGIADAVEDEPVVFPCMDEWVHAVVETEPDGIRRPFADRSAIDAALDKTSLYGIADEVGVPYPETYRIEETGATGDGPPDPVPAAEAAEALGFPLVVKPARKREFEELVGTNVREVAERDAYDDLVRRAAEADVRLLAQAVVDRAPGEDRSLASYRGPDGEVQGLVGNPVRRHPSGYGTSCVVDVVDDRRIATQAGQVIEATGYWGISEAEFVYDRDREAHVLLDVNTRPWKWIGLPIAAGHNLPLVAYEDVAADADPDLPDAVDEEDIPADAARQTVTPITEDCRWVSLADYVSSLAEGAPDLFEAARWEALLSGRFRFVEGFTTAVYRPSDLGPAVQQIRTRFGEREYYCAC